MQQQIHYSVSIHATSFRTVTAQQPNAGHTDIPPVPSSTTSAPHPSALTEQHAGLAAVRPPQNGFKTIKDAARRDFFTIRADAIQDGVLSLLDSLAEYLVWDGMDRRLRAIASATHTEHPEAVVSVQQIANDIKARVGHDLCERTIERALKKLCDVGLLSATARFHQGRRQASSYILLYAPSMSSRLENSRRGGTQKSQAVSDTPTSSPYRTQALDIQEAPYNALTRIGDRIPALSVYSDNTEENMAAKDSRCDAFVATSSNSVLPGNQPTIATENDYVPSGYNSSAHPPQHKQDGPLSDFRQGVTTRSFSPVRSKAEVTGDGNNRILTQSKVCRSAHSANEVAKCAVPGGIVPVSLHPTSMSPLFNKEKENKKVFKNVFCFSDFSKKETSPVDTTEPVQERINGYYLDVTHHAGWVFSENQALRKYIGDLSRCLFFKGYRTMESMSEWFQKQERNLQSGELSIADILTEAGLTMPLPMTSIAPDCRYGA